MKVESGILIDCCRDLRPLPRRFELETVTELGAPPRIGREFEGRLGTLMEVEEGVVTRFVFRAGTGIVFDLASFGRLAEREELEVVEEEEFIRFKLGATCC